MMLEGGVEGHGKRIFACDFFKVDMLFAKIDSMETWSRATSEDVLKTNKLKFSQLVSMAVEKFISEPQTIKLLPAETKEFLDVAEPAFNKHKDAMDKLK